ncbi:MAG: hypothetical protein AAF383_28535, partial [Cyanobacteria bacterium P01_A01_bin.83]
YASQEPNISSFVLISSEVSSLGVICVSRANSVRNYCQKIVFTPFPSEDKPGILLAHETLAMIIDPNIPYKDLNPGDPVVPGYEVNLFKAK